MSNYWSPDITTGVDVLTEQSLRSVAHLHQLRHLVFGYANYAHNNSSYLLKLKDDLHKDPNRLNVAPMALHVGELAAEASSLSALGAAIDKHVLEEINDFIKSHEPYVRGAVDRLNSVVARFQDAYADVEKIRVKYDEYRRLKEFDSGAEVAEEEKAPPRPKTPVHESPVDDSPLEFPLWLGPVKITSASELSQFLQDIIEHIPTSKRTFPLPGRNPEVFSSESFCMWLTQRRPFRIDPTRSTLERFGQSMLDLNLIMGSSLMGAKKFRSEGMWFEWTELSQFASNPVTPTVQVSSPSVDIGATTKKFNDMFKNMKLFNTDYADRLAKLELQYNEKYYELQELRNLIDMEIEYQSQTLVKFEKRKIGLVYDATTKLAEILSKYSTISASRYSKFSGEVGQFLNNKDHSDKDFAELVEKRFTGIYMPSSLSPLAFSSNQFSTASANNNFQNIKYQFNLFKDIPLQPQLAQADKEKLLSLASLPLFVNDGCRLIEEKIALVGVDSGRVGDSQVGDQSVEDPILQQLWLAPLNHHNYWSVKEKIINNIGSVKIDPSAQSEFAVQQTFINRVIETLSHEDLPDVTNFFKNWLLEISDSVIPCSVYDSLLQNYSSEIPSVEETIKILSAIPRSNLSTLIFILEHVLGVFELDTIPGFGFTDEVAHELKSPVEVEQSAKIISKLNSMDQIGGVPFMHLILRPSIVKSARGFKPPIEKYNMLLKDLINLETRCELLNNLVTQEKSYLSKKESEKHNLGLQKKLPLPPSPSVNQLLKSPKPVKADNFSLRPFHTKVTPAPSPNGSPRAASRTNRDRSASGSLLAPGIDIEFEK